MKIECTPSEARDIFSNTKDNVDCIANVILAVSELREHDSDLAKNQFRSALQKLFPNNLGMQIRLCSQLFARMMLTDFERFVQGDNTISFGYLVNEDIPF